MATTTCKKCGSPFSEQEARAGYDTCERCPADPEPSATSHTPEPWLVDDGLIIGNPDSLTARVLVGTTESYKICHATDFETSAANARRIVACVNACAEISNEALEGGVIAKLVSLLNLIRPNEFAAQSGDLERLAASPEHAQREGMLRAITHADVARIQRVIDRLAGHPALVRVKGDGS